MVIEAIEWLKANNPLYNQVMLNDMWLDDWSNSEFSSFCKVNLKENVLIHLHIVTQTIPIQKCYV